MKFGLTDDQLRNLMVGKLYTNEERSDAEVRGFQTIVLNYLGRDIDACKKHGITFETRVDFERKQIIRKAAITKEAA